jgi:hypothetical protein
MPSINSVNFDLSDCKLVEQSDGHRMWSGKDGIYYCLRVFGLPIAEHFDLSDITAASHFFSRQCSENKGVMLEMDIIGIQQFKALRGLFKYRSPIPKSLGMMFVHIIWIPFQKWMIQFNIESVEIGTTGARETAVMMIEGGPKLEDLKNQKPIIANSAEDMFTQMRASPLRAISADNEKYDQMFSDHPLSKVRRRMKEILPTFIISASPSDLISFKKSA